MVSFDGCDKIKGELRSLLLEGETFDSDDLSCLWGYIADLDNPKGILEHVIEFKEDGNSLFKKGDVDNALEKYGFGGIFLSCLALEREEDKDTFVNLSNAMLLNMTACLLKKKLFMQAGNLCTIVLDHSPTNVKALFRRASAAMELGRNDLASTDLKLALIFDPSNQEARKKLSEVNDRISKELVNQSEYHDKLVIRDERMEVEPLPRIATILKSNHFKEEGDKRIDVTSVEEGKLIEKAKEDVKSKEVEMIDANSNRRCEKSYIPIEPKHQFHNRRTPGSFLNIPKKDYSKLAQGKTIQYCNSRSGVIMSIRVVDSQKITTKDSKENEGENFSLSNPNLISEFKEEVGDNFNDQSLNQCEESSQTHLSKNQLEGANTNQPFGGTPRVHDYSLYTPCEQGHFDFQSISVKRRNFRGLTRVRKKNRPMVKSVRRSKNDDRKNPNFYSSNHMCHCRFRVDVIEEGNEHLQMKCVIHPRNSGVKRKFEPMQSLDFPQQPRKLVINNDNSCSSCFYNMWSSSVCNVTVVSQFVAGAKLSPYC